MKLTGKLLSVEEKIGTASQGNEVLIQMLVDRDVKTIRPIRDYFLHHQINFVDPSDCSRDCLRQTEKREEFFDIVDSPDQALDYDSVDR